MSVDGIILSVAESQHNVFHVHQVRDRVSRNALRKRIDEGLLLPLHPGVFALASATLDMKALSMAATLYAGEGSATSHRTACRLRGIEGIRPSPIDVASTKALRPQDRLLIHRPKRLPAWQIEPLHGIPTTIVPRSLLDLCAIGKPWECSDALDSALRQGICDIPTLLHMIEVESKPGRTGIRLFRTLVWERDEQKAPPQSVLAARFLRWLRSEGFPEPEVEYRVHLPGGVVKDLDFAYPNNVLGFQVDGYRHHAGRFAHDDDREGDWRFIAIGWRIMRITDTVMRNHSKRRDLALAISEALRHQVCSTDRTF
jgi:hypothetical protein